MNKNSKKIIIIIVLITIFTFGVSATNYLYSANNVSYSNANLSGNNVQTAIDNLLSKYQTSTTTCPSGMTCTDKTNIKCRRATSLHTGICDNDNDAAYCKKGGYSLGETITYGNNVITEGILSSGDAFDCDVNGDGTYDAATERFYYVSDYFDASLKVYNDKIAVLIYYSNVYGGVASNTTYQYALNSDIQAIGSACSNSDGCNWFGPISAKKQLPTTTQWPNITLYKEERQILTERNNTASKGNNLPTNFSYAGYAARLLNYQEFYRGCNDFDYYFIDRLNILNYCTFLMENTNFESSNKAAFWLENASDSYDKSAKTLSGSVNYQSSQTYVTNNTIGIRPAIEVPKSQISY